MARSEMGNLIARNHDDIEYLRKIGDRDYFEFTLTKDKPEKVDGVNLTLKKTNVKHYRFTLATLVDDMQVDRKDCNVNSPVYFYVNGSKKPFELVVNRVESSQVKGYISAPEGSHRGRFSRARGGRNPEHVQRTKGSRGETLGSGVSPFLPFTVFAYRPSFNPHRFFLARLRTHETWGCAPR